MIEGAVLNQEVLERCLRYPRTPMKLCGVYLGALALISSFVLTSGHMHVLQKHVDSVWHI